MYPGLIAGLLGCAFGVLGILPFGLIFVPFAAGCSLIGLARSLSALSGPGLGVSILGAILTLYGVVASPTLWPFVAASLLANHGPSAKLEPNTQINRSAEAVVSPDVAGIGIVIEHIDDYNRRVEISNNRLPTYEIEFRAITSAMDRGLASQRSLDVNDSTAVARGKVNVALNQANVRAVSLGAEINTARNSYTNEHTKLFKEIGSADLKCREMRTQNKTISELWGSACKRLINSVVEFNKKSNQIGDSLGRVDLVRQAEQAKQNAILRASDVASRY